MSEWHYERISDLGRVVTGSTPPAKHPEWFGGGTPFLTPSDISAGERRARPQRRLSPEGRIGLRSRLVPRGSVCFVSIGATIGKICLTEVESITNQQINTVVPWTKTDAHFIYYLLRNEASRIASTAGGAATPLLNKTAFAAVMVSVPDLSTQNKIGAILCALDDLIENNRQRMRVLDDMSRAIYSEWFVHFRYPGHQNVTLVDSPLGPIPGDWTVATLGQVLELCYGRALKKEDRRGGTTAVVSSAGIVGWHDEHRTDGSTIVVGRKGNVGSVTWVDGPCWPIDTAYYVKTDLPLRYVVEQLRRTEFLNTHAAVPGLSREQAYSRPFLKPTRGPMGQFAALSQVLASAASVIAAEAERLRSMRDLLLPKLVSGQIDVSSLDLEALFEGSVA